jgi:hypothetical protein
MARGCDDEKPIVKQLLKYQTVGVPRGVLRAYADIDRLCSQLASQFPCVELGDLKPKLWVIAQYAVHDGGH